MGNEVGGEMIIALLIGRDGSVGFPGKNVYPILERPLMVYPLLAALNSKYVDEIYVSTDSERIKSIANEFKVNVIDRSKELATDTALSEDVFVHGYNYIKQMLRKEIEFMVLLFCNAPMILSETIDKGIEVLRSYPELDSAITVSRYNMWSPVRARRISEDGLLQPFISFDSLDINMDSNRDSQGDVYFHDCGVSVVRTKCLYNIEEGLLPQKWMGRKIYPLIQGGGLDVDYIYEIPIVENWLREKGFTEKDTPYEKKQ